MTGEVHIIGGGPAGSAAALAARASGARVRLFEPAPMPRHKVCGEFLSPEAEHVLRALRAWDAFEAAGPRRLHEVRLHFGRVEKRWRLERPAFSLSRYALDHLLLDLAAQRGVEIVCRRAAPGEAPAVVAHGRRHAAARGARLFGFKAHFRGDGGDGVDLFFFSSGYVGVSAVEAGAVNVCGLAPEHLLRAVSFDIDAHLDRSPELRERLAPFARAMEWMVTGPLIYSSQWPDPAASAVYPAGDALGFVDPFTGSGLTAALATGRLAGDAAAAGIPVSEYLRQVRLTLGAQYRVSALARAVLEAGWAAPLARWVPGSWLFRLTRPRLRPA